MKEKLNEKRDKLNALKVELSETQTKDKEKQWEIDQLKVEKADLQQRLDVAEKNVRNEDKKAQDMQNQVAFYQEKVESMQGENAAMFESSIAAKEAELNAMRAELSIAQEQLQGVTEELRKKTKDVDSIAAKLDGVVGDKLKAERLNERLKHELDQANEVRKETEAAERLLEQRVTKLEADRRAKLREKRAAERSLTNAKRDEAHARSMRERRLESAISSTTRDNKRMVSEIEQLKDKIENKMHEYHIKLIELSRESQTKLDDLDNERIKMEKKAFTAENEVERLLKECTEWTRYKEKQTQIEEQLKRELEAMQDKNKNYPTRWKRLAGERETLQDSIRRTENMLEDVSTRNSKMDKELITLREQIRDSRAKYEDVVGTVNALEAKKIKLTETLEISREEFKRTKQHLEKMTEEVKTKTKQYADAKRQRDELAETVLIASRERERNATERADLIRMQAELRSQLEEHMMNEQQLQKEYDTLHIEAEKNEKLRRKYDDVRARFQNQNKELKRLQMQEEELRTNLKESRSIQYLARDEEIQALRRKVRFQNKQLRESREALAAQEQQMQNLESTQRMLEAMEKD